MKRADGQSQTASREELRPSIASSQGTAERISNETMKLIQTMKEARGLTSKSQSSGSQASSSSIRPTEQQLKPHQKLGRQIAKHLREQWSQPPPETKRTCADDTICDISDCPGSPETVIGDLTAAVQFRDRGAPGTGYRCPKHKVIHKKGEHCVHFRPNGKRIRHRELRQVYEESRKKATQECEGVVVPSPQVTVATVQRTGPTQTSASAASAQPAATTQVPTSTQPDDSQTQPTAQRTHSQSPKKSRGKWNISEMGWKMPTFDGKNPQAHELELWIQKWNCLAREKGLRGQHGVWAMMEFLQNPALAKVRQRLGTRLMKLDDPEVVLAELRTIYDAGSRGRQAKERFSTRDQEPGESIRDYMDALLAFHGEMDSKASRVGINDAVYQRFYQGLRDAELVTVSAKRIISAKALKLSTKDDDFLDVIVREAEAEKQVTRKLLRELPKKVGEKKALKVVQELPD